MIVNNYIALNSQKKSASPTVRDWKQKIVKLITFLSLVALQVLTVPPVTTKLFKIDDLLFSVNISSMCNLKILCDVSI